GFEARPVRLDLSGIKPGAASPPLWPYLLAFSALIVLGLAFGEMAKEARQEVPDGLDLHAIHWVSRHHREWPGLTHLFLAITVLGNPEVATASTLLVAAVLVWLGRHKVGRLRKREALFWLGVAI